MPSTLRLVLGAWMFVLFCLFAAAATAVPITRLADWLPVSVISSLVGALVIATAVRVGGRRSLPLSQGHAIAASTVVGGIVGTSQVLSSQLLGLDDLWQPGLVIASATLTIGVIGTGAILFVQAYAEQVARRSQQLAASLSINESREDVAEIAGRMRQMLANDIDVALSPARISLEERLRDQADAIDDEDWAATARELRAAVSETVGPLSRRLWAPVIPGKPRLTLWSIVRDVVTRQPFQPLAMALIVVVTFFAGMVTALGWVEGLSIVLIGTALVWSILTLANAVMRRWPNHHAGLYIATIMVLESIHLLASAARVLLGGLPYSLLEFVVAAIVGGVLVLLTSAFGALRDYREDAARAIVIKADRELMTTITASRQVAQLARESARVLHGTVQTRLIACAVTIERASENRDVDAFRAALREAHEVLTQPTLADDAGETTLATEVERKVHLWSGLCDVSVEIDPRLAAIPGRRARDAGRVVEEGLSNAIRHGGADVLNVRVIGTETEVVIEVQDNGSGPAGGGPGLGSALLANVSSSWVLEACSSAPESALWEPCGSDDARGARLRVTLP